MACDKYWIYREPVGRDYTRLVEFCAKRSFQCTFVLQRPQQFGDRCCQFLDNLKEHLIEVANQMEWPGTRLTRSPASVYWYRVTPGLIAAVKTAVRGLYEWSIPDLPEDLAFYCSDGNVLLGTSSHERFAFINLTEEEIDDFKHELPELRLSKIPPPELV